MGFYHLSNRTKGFFYGSSSHDKSTISVSLNYLFGLVHTHAKELDSENIQSWLFSTEAAFFLPEPMLLKDVR